VNKLQRYTEYQFRVKAENKYGLGEPLISEICRADYQYSKSADIAKVCIARRPTVTSNFNFYLKLFLDNLEHQK